MEKDAKQSDAKATNRLTVEQHTAVLNAIPAHVALLDSNGVILAVNEAWRRFTTANVLQSSDFFVGQNYLGVCESALGDCADEARAVAIGIRKVLSGEIREFGTEYPCHSPSEQRWYRLMVTPLSETPGAGAVVMHVDVTQRRLAEEVLSQKEREQRQIAEKLIIETRRLHESQAVANVGSWETDLATLKVTWTDETHRIFENNPEEFEISHQGFLERVHPEDRDRVEAAFLTSIGEPGPFAIEHRLLMPDGRIKIVEERWQTFADATGKPERAVGTCQDITKRKQAERAVTISEASLARAQRIARMGNWDWNIVTGELYWSAQIFELFGIDPANAPGTYERFINGVHPEDRERTHQAVMAAVEGRAPYNVEHRVLWPDGTVRVMHEQGEVTRDEAGRPLNMIGTVLDITERKAADAAVREQAALLDKAQDAILVRGLEGRITYWNKGAERLYGWTAEQALGGSARELIYSEPSEFDIAMTRLLAAGEWSGELPQVTKDGRKLVIEGRWTLLKDDDGRPKSILAINTDITERKRTQEALAATQRQYRDLVETSHNVIWSVDMEGRFTFLNQASRAVFGRAPEEMIGRRFHEFVPEDQHQANDDIFARLFRDGQDVIDYSNRIRRGDGSIAILNSNARVVLDGEGQRIGVSGMSQDTTESVRAQEAIAQSEARFRGLFDQAALGMCIVSAEGDFLRTNARFCEIVGYSPAELLQRDGIATTHPEEREMEAKIVGRILAGELPSAAWEKRYVHKAGHAVWCNLTLSLLPGGSGRPPQLVAVIEDISERRATVEQLRHREQLLGIAGKAAQLGGWSVDLPEVRINWSDEVCAIHDMPIGTVPTLEQANDFYPPESRPVIESAFTLCTVEGTPFDLELELLTAKERRIWVRVIGQAERDAAGTITRVQGATQDITEHKLAQNRLQSSESLRRIAGSVAKIGGWSISVPDNRLDWADEIYDVLEYPRGPVPSLEEALQLYPEPWLTKLTTAISACATHGTPFDLELMIKSGKGRLFWARCKAEAGFDDKGKIVVVRGAFQDISEQRAAENQVRELGGRLANTLETITDAFFTVDREWRFTYLNAEAENLLVRDRASLLGRNIWDEFPAGVGSTFQREYQRALAEMQGVSFEEYFTPLSKWFEVRAFPSTDGLAVYFHDVTELRDSREALAASEKEFRNLAEAMPQIVWITRPDGWTIYFNQHWMDYTGLTPEESLGHDWNKPFHPEDQQRAWDAWQIATATVGTYSLECRLRRADGEYRWWLIRGEPQRDADGNVVKWFGTCTDIHSLKIAELEITRTNRALKMLSACNEALIHAVDESDLLRVICEIAVANGGYRMAWVGFAQEDAKRTIQPMAHAGEEAGYLSEVALSWEENTPDGDGPAGRTIRTGQPNLSEDIELDASFHWRDVARQRGYRSVICLPLRSGDRTFGLLGLYSAEVLQAGAEELKLLQELADDLAFGIGHLRAQRESERIHSVVTRVATAVSASTGSEFFEQLAESMAGTLGAAAGFVAEMVPGEPPGGRTIAGIVDGKKSENFDYAIAGTPCAQLLADDEHVVADRVAELFPKASKLAGLGAKAYVGRRLTTAAGEIIGVIFVLFREPLKETAFITSTLRIFAARATSELERQKSDKQLREQAALLDAAHDAILVRDLDDRVLYWNKGAERLYGWAADEVMGRQASGFLYGALAEMKAARQEVLKKDRWEGELRTIGKDGRPILVQASWTLLRDSDGRPTSVLAINSDLTEKKKLEAQFLRAQRMESIGTLAGGIAHDLNNVLAPIMMSVELLKLTTESEEDQELLATLLSSAQRGANLVSQVLSFARGVEGQRIPVNVGHLIRELVRVMKDTFPKNLTLEFKPSANLWSVIGDPTQIHQVILNLCVNARDAMPTGGTLMIGAKNVVVDDTYASMNQSASPGSYVVIKVEDSGTGIPPELAERVFEPFFTTKETGQGTGLGLSTTAAIVKSHGGFINLYSELGTGTRFKIYFPADASQEAAEQQSIQQTRLPRGKGELVLVVDDEESIRSVAKSTLERFGYSVMLAAHGAEAIAIYAQHQSAIAVILTDMAMPIMDGPTMIIALKSINPDVRIIGSSGLGSNGGTAKAVGAGVEHFIPKPYTAEAMLKTIRASLDSP